MTSRLEAIIEGCGNRFPEIGDRVYGADGDWYKILEFSGPIYTGELGFWNYIYARVQREEISDKLHEVFCAKVYLYFNCLHSRYML